MLRVSRERNWEGGIVPGLCSVTGLEGSLEQFVIFLFVFFFFFQPELFLVFLFFLRSGCYM